MARTSFSQSHVHVAKWFFVLLSIGVLLLAWKVIEPFVVLLATAAIFAIVLTPFDRWIEKRVKSRKISVFLTLAAFILGILIPVSVILGLVVDEAVSVAVNVVENSDSFSFELDAARLPFFETLPEPTKNWLLDLDVGEVIATAASQLSETAGQAAVKGAGAIAQFFFHLFIFFIALLYFLKERERIYAFVVDVSPFKDSMDREIIHRIVYTVRTVMVGALVIALIQGTLAAIGLAAAGVPAPILWGAVTVIAAQVPMIGVSLVMGPAVIWLLIQGNIVWAVVLTIWAALAIGTVDNFLTPKLIGSKTKMPELFILIFILGGIGAFGAIGFILGPTILAAILVLVEIYRAGFLEGKTVKKL